MRIPVKITPDRIRDSIIQVFFMADIPFEPLIGFCFDALYKAGWKYTNRQPLSAPQQGLVIELAPSSQHFFVKDQIRLQLFPNQSLAFNCINHYIGWAEYGRHIRTAIESLSATGHFVQYNRLGIRYISEFANIDILENIQFNATTPRVDGKLVSSTYRFVFEENGVTKNIQIASKVPVNASGEKVNFVSILDVDIVKRGLKAGSWGDLWQEIEALHNLEKATFFGLLTNEFLQSLNPEYT